jgi:hypothetical protein
MNAQRFSLAVTVGALLLLTGCATQPVSYDYSAFNKAKPVTLLVMPPVSDSPDVKATPAVWAQATLPLAEAGYYVLPVTLVDEAFRQNGVQTATDAQDIPYPKLRDFFGADAAVYIKVTRYGTSYAVIASETRVDAEARIVDLRSGELLWQGKASASSAEQQQSQSSLAGILVAALVNQIVGTTTDAAFNFAGVANSRLLGASRHNGILPGPRSPLYGKRANTP